jgi:hypothetical protein
MLGGSEIGPHATGDSLSRFCDVSVNVPPLGPPCAETDSMMRVERFGTHVPGLSSYSSSKMIASAPNDAENDGPYDG